tara:strand:- start:232 stop:825 length:594 start_codon:yes stop_codon:yes gene_type:complete
MQSDVFAITPSSDDNFYFASATATGTITLLRHIPARNGAGYKVSVQNSAGDDSSTNYNISGFVVGDLGGRTVTETLAGGESAVTVFSTNFYSELISFEVDSGTSVGTIQIGYGGDLALPRTRIKAFNYAAQTAAGSITVSSNEDSVLPILEINSPAGIVESSHLTIPENGILTTGTNINSFATVTLSNITNLTLYCG